MNDRDQRRYDRVTRVQTFGDDYAFDLANSDQATTLFGDLDDLIARFDRVAADGSPDRVSKETLFDALRLDLKNISRTAQSIGLDEPGFAGPYRMPGTHADRELLRHADTVLARLEDQPGDSALDQAAKTALRARFTAYDLPAAFVADLRAARQAIADTEKHNQSEDLDGRKNNVLLGGLLGEMNEVILKLNAIMHNRYTRQPEKLRAWQSASHVERDPRRDPSAPASTPPNPPAPGSAAPR